MSTSSWDPPETATSDAELPTAATVDPSTDISRAAKLEKRSETTTAAARKVCFSHVRMKVQLLIPRSSYSRRRDDEREPGQKFRQKSGQQSGQDNRLKAKQQCKSRTDRVAPEPLPNLSQPCRASKLLLR